MGPAPGDEPRTPLPAHRRPTIKDVAAEAGVSPSAASRALRDDGYVGERSRRRVLEAAARLGYVPHLTARYLKDRVSRCVGAVVLDLTRPAAAGLVAGVCDAARAEGLATMVVDLAGRREDAPHGVRDLVAFGVAGVVVGPGAGEVARYLARYGVPVVEVGSPSGECDGVEAADDDDPVDLGRAAVRCLVDRFARPDGPPRVLPLGAVPLSSHPSAAGF